MGLVMALVLTIGAPPEGNLEALPEADRNEAAARSAWEQGTLAYRQGRLEDAVRHFEETYRYSGRSGLLFSLGQAHRHLYESGGDERQRHLAIVRFQQYLEVEPEGKRKVEAERFLAELLPLSQLELEGMGEAALFTRVSVSSLAPGATVVVDDGEPVELPATPDVEPGAHTILVSAPGFHPARRNVDVPEGSTVSLEVPLRELEARLTVKAPGGADLYVDGQRVARLPVDAGVELAPGRHQIGVARTGRALFVRELELDRGEERELDASLEMTGQRKVSFATMAIGSAGIVTSGVFVGLALDAQQRARAIVAQQNESSISAAQELQRSELVTRRDAMRNAAIASGVTGAVVLATGVILYLTDRPPVASRLSRPDNRPRAMRLGPGGVEGRF